ncbi:MAG: polyprenyl synthetase family protein [Oscillospiraceae bacterium]|jgi:geranylgeranyl diphosphate synthase type II|nr:polyprenyl synthetase family protein [Oscillospiraceae bacterium]
MFKNEVEKINDYIEKIFLTLKDCEKKLLMAMRHSVLIGGKRIRPILLIKFCKACGGKEKLAMPFACALEMIHTYSLIHDDLPCMDDSDLRRGKPSTHVVFGEATALLAGDGLLTLAFEIVSSAFTTFDKDSKKVLKSLEILSKSAGPNGMVSGQSMDLKYENKIIDEKKLQKIHEMKTAKLIVAAAHIGCVVGGGGESQILSAKKYAKNIGLAFQITDDVLDCESTSASLGKPTQTDKKMGKSTFPKLIGINECKRLVKKLTQDAILSLKNFKGDTSGLKFFAEFLSKRDR